MANSVITKIWFAVSDVAIAQRKEAIQEKRAGGMIYPAPIMLDLQTGDYFPATLRARKQSHLQEWVGPQGIRVLGTFSQVELDPMDCESEIPEGVVEIANCEGFVTSALDAARKTLGAETVNEIKERIKGGAYYSYNYGPQNVEELNAK